MHLLKRRTQQVNKRKVVHLKKVAQQQKFVAIGSMDYVVISSLAMNMSQATIEDFETFQSSRL